MDKKVIISTTVGVIITLVVTLFFTRGEDVVQAGINAKTAETIREVLKEEMQVDINGETKTYGQVLSSLHTKVTANEATLNVLIED